MKREWKHTPIVLMALSILLLAACSRVPAGERPLDTAQALQAVQTGTQGVELTLLGDYPPALIYDQNELVAIIEVNNRGNHDLEPEDCFVQISGFDSNIITGNFNQPRSCADGLGGPLEGKNVYNVQGSSNQVEFRSSNILLPQNVFEYNPTLNFLSCYNYHTIANPSVCVDPLFYQITSQQKSCLPLDVSMAGGQGAPVGVNYVGVDMAGSKAVFEISVRNFGTGRVLSPNADIRSCGQASLEYTDLDKVEYTVQMSGGNLIDCKPRDGIVRLNNNLGKIVCQFDIPGASAFDTPLMIDLDYSYIQSFTKPLKIVQTPR